MLNYEKIKDIVYRKTNDCNLHLDLLVPRAKNDEKIPCCVFFHGGGWKEGSRQDVDGFPIITDKIIESGGAVASVECRQKRRRFSAKFRRLSVCAEIS